MLVLETMYYADEVRKPESVNGRTRLQKAEVEMAKSLVENLSESFKPERYDDTYRKELLDLIRSKAKGKKLPEPQEEEEAEVVDLMAALRESVDQTRREEPKAGEEGKLASAEGQAGRLQEEARPEEDAGAVRLTKRGQEPIFVVQRHDARRLHYDFRLERNGALASWAVPKGVPLEPGQQHLAVHVEDHPLEYATFEGEIPKGQYGAGTVEIWDKGTYELVEEKNDGGLTVRLHGERLKGTYALVPAKLSGDPKNWLILRKKDDSAPAARDDAPVPADARDARPRRCPRGDWLYEIKWDGYRIVATVSGGDPELRTRKDQDYTKRFENVAKELVKALKTPDCVVDGEVCALDEDGRPSFSAMQQGKPGTPIVYFVFDLLEVEGEPLVELPLEERRKRLEKLLDKRNRTIRFSETFDDGEALLEAANQQSLEGIMAKRLGSKYLPGQALTRVAEDQGPRAAGVRDRRLHAREGQAPGDARLARARDVRGRRPRLRRERRHGLQRPRDRPAPEEAEAARAEHAAVQGRSEDAAREEGRRRLGRAEARRRGRVRRVDARRAPAGARVQGPAGGQGCDRGAARGAGAVPGRDPQGQARASSRRTSTSSSGRTRGSPRATCSRTTTGSRPC